MRRIPYEALAPLLFALKDWTLGKFADAGKLFAQYLNSAPKDPFQWVADYKPIAQKYADQEAAFEQSRPPPSAAADTPDKRADALKQAQDLEAKVKGEMAAPASGRLEQEHQEEERADSMPLTTSSIAEEKQRDEGLLADAKRKYAADAPISVLTRQGPPSRRPTSPAPMPCSRRRRC